MASLAGRKSEHLWPTHTHTHVAGFSATNSSTHTRERAPQEFVVVGHITSLRHAFEVDGFFNIPFGLQTL